MHLLAMLVPPSFCLKKILQRFAANNSYNEIAKKIKTLNINLIKKYNNYEALKTNNHYDTNMFRGMTTGRVGSPKGGLAQKFYWPDDFNGYSSK